MGRALFQSERFPTLFICHTCLRTAHLELHALMGSAFIEEVLSRPESHLLKWLVVEHCFALDSNNSMLVPAWKDLSNDSP